MRTIALTTLLVATLAVPASSQEVASPSPSSEAGAAAPVEELGGTWRRMAAAPFGAVEVPGGWTGTEL
ncbi:MAG: hypothetical protein AB1Z66_03520, partial [Candidatus Limnocylindrales bacterium]